MTAKQHAIMSLIGGFGLSYISTEVFGYGILDTILLVITSYILMHKITKLEVTK